MPRDARAPSRRPPPPPVPTPVRHPSERRRRELADLGGATGQVGQRGALRCRAVRFDVAAGLAEDLSTRSAYPKRNARRQRCVAAGVARRTAAMPRGRLQVQRLVEHGGGVEVRREAGEIGDCAVGARHATRARSRGCRRRPRARPAEPGRRRPARSARSGCVSASVRPAAARPGDVDAVGGDQRRRLRREDLGLVLVLRRLGLGQQLAHLVEDRRRPSLARPTASGRRTSTTRGR